MNTIVEVRDLWYSYPHLQQDKPEWVLRGVDFRLQRGEFVCLLGPSGAGKTTLALAMNGIVPQSTGGRIRGGVFVQGQDAKRHPVADMAKQVGIVFQDPETQFLQTTVRSEVAFGLENLGIPRIEIRERLDWALDRLGLTGFEARAPAHLSGGEKQRVAIAAVLAMRPMLLVLDEPTTSLDPMGKEQVFESIRSLRQDHTVLMITQDSERAAEYADRVMVLNEGEIVMEGVPLSVLTLVEELRALGLRPPEVSELAHCLNRSPSNRFSTLEEAVAALSGGVTTA
jgi:energy-coupling factor transporter ATP-binding protein EcfA2